MSQGSTRASCGDEKPRYARAVQTMSLWLPISILVLACSKPAEPPSLPLPRSVPTTSAIVAPTASVPPEAPAASSQAKRLEDDGPLEEGLVSFEGMLRPTKGGYDVRGVTFDDTEVRRQMAGAMDGIPSDPEWFLGARVRVRCVLRMHSVTPKKGGLVEQTREGTFFLPSRIEAIELVKNAETLEGVLARSKGYFSLNGHLVSRDDLAWSLAPNGGTPGDRVRLRGQSRTVHCAPNAQCLIGGSLPLFDVGRAERLP